MPYAEPTSAMPSPVSKTGFMSPLVPVEPFPARPSSATGPMPGIPRRSSSNHYFGNTTSGSGISPSVSRQSNAAYQSFPSSRPMDGSPRRTSGDKPGLEVAGLPSGSSSGGLALNLHPCPANATLNRGALDLDLRSSSTTEGSSLLLTPAHDPQDPLFGVESGQESSRSVPFPSFEPPHTINPSHPPRRPTASPPRPSLSGRRGLGHHQRGHGPTGSLGMEFTTSASAAQLTGSVLRVISSQSIRPTASMIRKKSGEVVKPSLKARSMSTPDLSRQGDASEPSTPENERDRGFPEERSKSVRFAGADEDDGHALESVVLFLQEQKPAAVGKAADPDQAGMFTETETEADTEASDFVQFRTRRNAAARAADEAETIVLGGGSRVPRIRVDFAPDARGSLIREYIVLERAELTEGMGPLTMRGSVIVRNVAFQKWVTVRFTLDHWQTVSEVSGNHVCHVPSATTGDEGWDRFGFSIKLEDYKRKLDERQLLMCIRYNVDGREWWDSNVGLNYNFSFRKAVPKRPTRVSGSAALGGGYMRASDAQATSLLGRRQNCSVSPASKINNPFGASDSSRAVGPFNWVFPKLSSHISDPLFRSELPIPSATPLSFLAPSIPDVHTHLSLSKYCAPSPPTSPPKEHASVGASTSQPVTPLSASSRAQAVNGEAMNILGGQHATLSPPVSDAIRARRSSSGEGSGSWDSFATAMEQVEAASEPISTDGESTPVAIGSRSPISRLESSQESSPEVVPRPLAFMRSTGDLRALMTEDSGLITPPSSNPSPPSPVRQHFPPESMSPSPSPTSTGESSPVHTVSSDSSLDLSSLSINVDPEERGRRMRPNHHKMLSNSYQEFLDKFCFFQSPATTPTDERVLPRTPFVPRISGNHSPSGSAFHTSRNSDSPRDPSTPMKYDSSQDAFMFAPMAGGSATPRGSPPLVNGLTDPHVWASQHSPSLTVAT